MLIILILKSWLDFDIMNDDYKCRCYLCETSIIIREYVTFECNCHDNFTWYFHKNCYNAKKMEYLPKCCECNSNLKNLKYFDMNDNSQNINKKDCNCLNVSIKLVVLCILFGLISLGVAYGIKLIMWIITKKWSYDLLNVHITEKLCTGDAIIGGSITGIFFILIFATQSICWILYKCRRSSPKINRKKELTIYCDDVNEKDDIQIDLDNFEYSKQDILNDVYHDIDLNDNKSTLKNVEKTFRQKNKGEYKNGNIPSGHKSTVLIGRQMSRNKGYTNTKEMTDSVKSINNDIGNGGDVVLSSNKTNKDRSGGTTPRLKNLRRTFTTTTTTTKD